MKLWQCRKCKLLWETGPLLVEMIREFSECPNCESKDIFFGPLEVRSENDRTS